MSLSQRARILATKQDGLPAEDVLRCVQPRAYLRVSRKASQAYSPKAANDGLEFANILLGKSGASRPWVRRENAVLPSGMVAGRISDRAAGVREEVMRATESASPRRRAAAYKRRVPTFKFQRWSLALAVKMCAEVASLLSARNCSVEGWAQSQFVGVWPFDVSRNGMRSCSKPGCESRVNAKTWCDAPGCPAHRKRVATVSRGATQLACRLNASGDKERKSLLRATRDSDEVRNPSCERWTVRTSARRSARGSPSVAESRDQWSALKATCRPAIAFPEGEPRAEPVELQNKFVWLKSDLPCAPADFSPPSRCGPPAVCCRPARWQAGQCVPVFVARIGSRP